MVFMAVDLVTHPTLDRRGKNKANVPLNQSECVIRVSF